MATLDWLEPALLGVVAALSCLIGRKGKETLVWKECESENSDKTNGISINPNLTVNLYEPLERVSETNTTVDDMGTNGQQMRKLKYLLMLRGGGQWYPFMDGSFC